MVQWFIDNLLWIALAFVIIVNLPNIAWFISGVHIEAMEEEPDKSKQKWAFFKKMLLVALVFSAFFMKYIFSEGAAYVIAVIVILIMVAYVYIFVFLDTKKSRNKDEDL